MKKAAISAWVLATLLLLPGCKSPEQIAQDVKDSKTTQEIVIRQELEREVRTLTVVGVGKVDAVPDVATVELSVSGQEATAEEAQAVNNEKMASVLDVIKSMGVKDTDIKTQEVAIFPVHDAEKGTNDIVAYSAVNTITVKVHRVVDTGELVTAAMQAGANELLHVEFHLTDETEAYREALNKAVEDAREKAEIMAPSLRVDLNGPGNVIEATNSILDGNNLVRYATELTGEQGDGSSLLATPLQAGLITVKAEVKVEYMLKYPASPTPAPLINE